MDNFLTASVVETHMIGTLKVFISYKFETSVMGDCKNMRMQILQIPKYYNTMA